MSIPMNITVNCSKCAHPIQATAFQSLNTNYADNIAKRIISGDLFEVKCPKCGDISHLHYDMLYHDINRKAMIWLINKDTEKYETRVAEARSTNVIPYKTTRIVEDMNALREKVACLESNRDDRIIELCKVFMAYNLLNQRPGFDFRNAFYTTSNAGELVFLYDNEGEELVCELTDKIYDYFSDLYFNSNYYKTFDDNYAIVDFAWANQIFAPLFNGQAKASESETSSTPQATSMSSDNQRKSDPMRPKSSKIRNLIASVKRKFFKK